MCRGCACCCCICGYWGDWHDHAHYSSSKTWGNYVKDLPWAGYLDEEKLQVLVLFVNGMKIPKTDKELKYWGSQDKYAPYGLDRWVEHYAGMSPDGMSLEDKMDAVRKKRDANPKQTHFLFPRDERDANRAKRTYCGFFYARKTICDGAIYEYRLHPSGGRLQERYCTPGMFCSVM